MRLRLDGKELRQKEAKERQDEYNALTVEQRIDRAISRPGESKRELARLRGEISKKKGKKK